MAAGPAAGAAPFSYSSYLSAHYFEQLEHLMFFNPGQLRATAAIVRAIERYGMPQIQSEGGRLRLTLDGRVTVQSLFACLHAAPKSLVGVLMYTRSSDDTLAILHVSLREDYAAGGAHADRLLLVRLIGRLREDAGRIRGIRHLEMFTPAGRSTRISV